MNSLLAAMQTKDAFSTNGAFTNSTSQSKCVDFFAIAGAARNMDEESLTKIFIGAFGENPQDAMRLLFYIRDVRGGQGERKAFRTLLKYLAINHTEVLRKNLALVPEYGRFDDLITLESTPLERDALTLWGNILRTGDRLSAKWSPRESSTHDSWARKLRTSMGLSPKSYRKLLAQNSHVVETPMCAGQWDSIEFKHVPSKAMINYRKAFERNCTTWVSYVESLTKGTTTVNASTLYPHELVSKVRADGFSSTISPTERELLNAQWKALPNYMEGSNERILPVVDVSGSMTCAAGKDTKTTCLDVSIALGLYCSERNTSTFKDAFITFSGSPTLQYIVGDKLSDRVRQLESSHWEMNTNLNAVFKLILRKALEGKVSQEDMPTTILIISDMEFDSCASMTGMEMIEAQYIQANYKIPRIVFWNVNARTNNIPVSQHKSGAALISGFSPSILKYLLKGDLEGLTPYRLMKDVIDSQRYAAIIV